MRRVGGEFFLIVIGVLTALGLEGWREDRAERATAAAYLQQLSLDLAYNEEHLQGIATGVEERLSHVRVALQILAGSHRDATPSARLTTLYLATRGATPALADATFQDLIATGSLRFIWDADLRNQVVAYHREAERWAVRNFELINENRVPYRNAVRSVIPLDLQEAIMATCDYDDVPLTCAPAMDSRDTDTALGLLEGDPQLPNLLRLWGSSLRTARGSVRRVIEPSRALRAGIDALLE
jgi:hypothetical protein